MNDELWQKGWQLYMWTLIADGGLWQDQGHGMGSRWYNYGDYICGLWQITLSSDKTRVMAWGSTDKSRRLYLRTLTADNVLWTDKSGRMRTLSSGCGGNSDSWPWVLTRQCYCIRGHCQTIHCADLAYMITLWHPQTLLLSVQQCAVSTCK